MPNKTNQQKQMAHCTDSGGWEASSVCCQTRRLPPPSPYLVTLKSNSHVAIFKFQPEWCTIAGNSFQRSSKCHLAECQLVLKSSLSPPRDKGLNYFSVPRDLWRNVGRSVCTPRFGSEGFQTVAVNREKKEIPLSRTLPFLLRRTGSSNSIESKSFNHLKLSLELDSSTLPL